MWVNKATWERTLERLDELEKNVSKLQEDNLIIEITGETERCFLGRPYTTPSYENHTLKTIIGKLLTHLNLQVKTIKSSETVNLVDTTTSTKEREYYKTAQQVDIESSINTHLGKTSKKGGKK